MSTYNDLSTFRKLILGEKVDKAATALPQTAAAAIFNIVGGRVAITAIVGEVTTVIQNQANNTKLTANPTSGTSVDICAVLNIAADEVGCLYGISGTVSDALQGINSGACNLPAKSIVVNTGSIDLDCAANNTGAIKWSLFYIPIDDGAYVVAA
jgi:hypothetical protein